MGTHFAVVVVVLIGGFAAAGVLSARHTLSDARRTIRLDAGSQGGVAARAIDASVAVAQSQVTSLAGNPAIHQVLADPAQCQLAFSLDLIPGGRIDVVRPDGQIACSSDPRQTGSAAGPWLQQITAGGGTMTAPFIDPADATPAVVIGAPIKDEAGRIAGAVVVFAPTSPIADQLAKSYAGSQHYRFALIDTSSGMTLSISTSSKTMPPGTVVPPGASPLGTDGLLWASQSVTGTTWRVIAAVDSGEALRSVHRVLHREAGLGIGAVVVMLALLAVVNRGIARPLRNLAHIVGDTGPEIDTRLGAARGPREVVAVAQAFRAAIATRETYEQELSHQALHDTLTGLPNRALLADRLARSLEQCSLFGGRIAVLFLDVDHFKLINDSLGHTVGDEVLKVIAGRLSEVLRPGDTLARFGGDEFVVVAQRMATEDEAAEFAERLLAAIQAPISLSATTVRLTASVGTVLSSPADQPDDLVRDADTAMYVAKEHGRGRHHRFDDTMRNKATARLTLETDLRLALERSELRLVYQPKIDLGTGEAIGVEALLRWDHPALGVVAPDTFIPVAEETGLIHPIGRFVLEQACQQAAAWRANGIDLTMAVNISGTQLLDAGLTEQITDILASTALEPDRLCLELTESVLMAHAERTARTLNGLHALGVQLSIDDFGTGYSSLAYLRHFPVDELKIDRAFINDLTARPDDRQLVAAMIAMATALGLRVVAEGVETVAQADALRAMGCDTGQGYLFARPQPPAALLPQLRSQRLLLSGPAQSP